jgi:hypothetical protein
MLGAGRCLVGIADRCTGGWCIARPGAALVAKGDGVGGPQPAAIARFAAATIFSTLGRYFISSRNSGMCVS